MSVEIRPIEDRDRWDELVGRSPHGTPFHLSGFLDVQAEWADATPSLLAGYVGEEPVGLLPFLRMEKGPLTALVSPAPDLKVSYGGPLLLNFEKLKRRKAERRHHDLVEAGMAYVDDELSPNFVHVRTTTQYDDVRPFVWNDFEASPGYTYVVDLTGGADALMDAFSTDARRAVRNGTPEDFEIREGGEEVVERIVEQVRSRHAELDESYPVTAAYALDVYRALPEGVVRPYAAIVDGAFVGGTITLQFGETAYAWQGSAKSDADASVNDLLKWRGMTDAIDAGVTRYDLVGANVPRISEYKAKFAPALEQYHELVRGSPLVRFGVETVRRFA